MAGAYVLIFFRWLIGQAFAVSAIGKASAFGSFRSTVTEFGVLPGRLAGPAAVASVAAEGLVVVLLAAGGIFGDAGFSLALALLAVFSVILGTALRKKANMSCNCFGPSQRRITPYDLVRNGALGLCCVGGLWPRPASAAAPPAPALILALGLAAVSILIIIANLEDFIEVLRKPYPYG